MDIKNMSSITELTRRCVRTLFAALACAAGCGLIERTARQWHADCVIPMRLAQPDATGATVGKSMAGKDYGDIIGGAALVAIGVAIAGYALTTMKLGTVSRMGPGMFPAALGVILAILGFMIVLPALFREGRTPQVDLRSMLAVSGSMLAFALLVRPFGLVPAIVALVAIASRADGKLPPIGVALVAGGLALASVLIFSVGLGLQLPAFAWPE